MEFDEKFNRRTTRVGLKASEGREKYG